MGRNAKISYEQVAAVAERLLAEKKAVSVREIREVLNAGSYSTVQRHFNSWRESQPVMSAKRIEIPPPLQSAILQALENAVLDARAPQLEQISEQIRNLEDLTSEAERLAEALSDVEQEVLAQREARVELNARLDEERTASALQAHRNEEAMKALQDAMTRDRQAADQVRLELAKAELRLEAVPRLELELQESRAQAAKHEKRCTALEVDLASARAELRSLRDEFQRTQAALKEETVSGRKERIRGDEMVASLASKAVESEGRGVALEATRRENVELRKRLDELLSVQRELHNATGTKGPNAQSKNPETVTNSDQG